MALPDEILREIITPPLLVSDDMFSDTGAVSPFSTVDKSSADVLLVCKQWMRVATPCLYGTVILRSMAQARALEVALVSTPNFGRYIKKLRVEGAYGDYVHTIVSLAPNIRDFCCSLTVWHNDSIEGLIQSFELLNPTRVILTLAPKKQLTSHNYRSVVSAFASAITSWTKLEDMSFAKAACGRWSSRSVIYQTYSQFEACPGIMDSVRASSTLRVVRLWRLFWNEHLPDDVLALAAKNNIQHIILDQDRPRDSYVMASLLRHIPSSLLPKFEFVGKGNATRVARQMQSLPAPVDGRLVVEPLPNPFYKPMSGSPQEVRTAVWKRIFGLSIALASPSEPRRVRNGDAWHRQLTTTTTTSWFDQHRFHYRTTVALMLTAREFYAVVVSLLLTSLSLNSKTQADIILGHLSKSLSLGEQVEDATERIGAPAAPLLALAPNLRRCSTHGDPAVLETLGRVVGKTLTSLTLIMMPDGLPKLALPLFAAFIHLTELHLVVQESIELIPPPAALTLPGLTKLSLNIRCAEPSIEVLNAMAQIQFPKLVEFAIQHSSDSLGQDDAFLRAHGKNLQRVSIHNGKCISSVLRECTGLQQLLVGERSHASFLRSRLQLECGNPQLHTLKLSWECTSNQRRDLPTWQEFFNLFTSARFPALRHIQLLDSALWPANERETARSPWVKFAETLGEQGIGFSDSSGRVWRTRLKFNSD